MALTQPQDPELEISRLISDYKVLPHCQTQNRLSLLDYSGPSGVQPNTNLQLRYELDETLLNPTTDANGQATATFNSSRCCRYY